MNLYTRSSMPPSTAGYTVQSGSSLARIFSRHSSFSERRRFLQRYQHPNIITVDETFGMFFRLFLAGLIGGSTKRNKGKQDIGVSGKNVMHLPKCILWTISYGLRVIVLFYSYIKRRTIPSIQRFLSNGYCILYKTHMFLSFDWRL